MRVSYILSLAIVMLFSWSCEDEPAQIGEEIFGGNLIDTKIFITSGDTLKAKNILSDGVDFNGIDYLMLGEYNDPIYGSVKADFVSELSLGSRIDDTAKIHFNNDFEYVKTELRLHYQRNSWIGDTLARHIISVYELSERLDPEFNYKSNFDPTGKYFPEPIGILDTFEVKNGARDTMWQVSSYTHEVAIDINDEVGQRLFEADSATITNTENFKNLFKGIYVTSEKKEDNRDGSILRIPYTLQSNMSQELAVIYRKKKILKDKSDQDSIAWDTIPKLFPINKEASKAIRYKHNYANTNINFSGDNADKIYLQGMGGTRAKINITDAFINEWKTILPDSNTGNKGPITSIASAEMSFYVDTITDLNYKNNLPEALSLYILDSKGKYVTPTFDNPKGLSNVAVFSGGTAKLTSDGALKYTFTMQNGFFEEFIYPSITGNSQKNYRELYLGIPNPQFNFNRVVLHGAGIERENENKSVLPSNVTVKYINID